MENDDFLASSDAPLPSSAACASLAREADVLVIGGVARSLDRLKPDTQERIRCRLERDFASARVDVVDTRYGVMPAAADE